MGRRIISFFLVIVLLCCCGCEVTPQDLDMKKPMKFYYRVTRERYEQEGTAAGAVNFQYFDIDGHENDYDWILSSYFQGPFQDELAAPFPKSACLVSTELKNRQMTVLISKEFSQLSGMDLSIACACITMTCLELPEVEAVTIRSTGGDLDGMEAVTMSADDLLLADLSHEMNSTKYMLYFSDTENRYLIAENFESEGAQEDLPTRLMKALIEGPEERNLAQTVPMDTKILNLEVDNGICNVNLSNEFLEQAPKTELAQRMTILSITNTLTQLEGINGVVLYIEGHRLDSYGAMDLRNILTYEKGAIGPARTSLNELDVNLYVPIGDSELLSPVPFRAKQSADKLKAEQVLDALCNYTGQNGYRNPIPPGTEVLLVSLEQDVCVVVFSAEFVQKPELVEQAVRSVCATIMGTGSYSAVHVIVDGVDSEEFAGLMKPLIPEPSWFSEDMEE